MDKAESLALYGEGRAAWNAWAEDLLARRAEFDDAGTWDDVSMADFQGNEFDEAVGFRGIIFPGDAVFDKAKFLGDAEFYAARFSGGARFGGARFSGDAGFREARFSGGAGFREARFSGVATFYKARFSGGAGFSQSTFKSFTSFAGCKFDRAADFSAIKGDTAFSLEGASFREVPDFNQAHFEEAPRLDVLSITPRGFKSQISTILKKGFKTERDLTTATRWSELKRLAVQRHDHQHELEFFRGELLERRGAADKPWHAAFWFGLFYQIFSGFGRSVLWPFIWWAVGVVGFAWAYLAEHVAHPKYIAAMGNAEGSPVFVFWRMIDAATGSASSLSCIAGPSNPWSAALGLSLQKALFAGIGSIRKLDQIQACLFGVHETGPLAKSFQPVIPDSVSMLGIVQFLWSAAMIFLMLLALRNHFRIK